MIRKLIFISVIFFLNSCQVTTKDKTIESLQKKNDSLQYLVNIYRAENIEMEKLLFTCFETRDYLLDN